MSKLFKMLDRFLKALIMVIACTMIVVGFMQVFTRYVLQIALPWSEELIRYCFVWTTFLGVPIGVVEGRHTKITILADRLDKRGQFIHELVVCLVELGVFVVMIIAGIQLIGKNMTSTSTAMNLPMRYVMAAVPVGGGIGILYLAKHFIDHIKDWKVTNRGGAEV